MRIDKDNIKIILILLVVCLGIGYSYLNTELNINGTANINSANWSVYWNNVQVESGSVTAPTPTIDSDKTTVSYTVTLAQPGDYYEFTVDAVNAGTIDAMIETIDSKLNGVTMEEAPAYLDYGISYADDTPLEENQELLHDSTETYKVHIGYADYIEADELPTTNQSLSLEFIVTYKQADDDAVPVSNAITAMINPCLEANCVYIIPPDDEDLWATWNTENETPTVFEETDYYTNYQDAINASEYGAFLGITLDNKRADRIFACYVYNDIPLCMEGTADGSKFEANNAIALQTEEYWNTTCTLLSDNISCRFPQGLGANYFDDWDSGTVIIFADRVILAESSGRLGIYTS